MQKIRRVFEGWKAYGAAVDWLDAGALADRLGASGYLGGWANETGLVVNPYALCQGLARAAVGAGVHLRQSRPVTRIRNEAAKRIVTAGGQDFAARKVVIATNGYTPDLYPRVQRTVIPVRLFHVFTRPLSDEERAKVLPLRSAFTDLRKSGGFARLSADNRLISGGAVFSLGNARSYGKRHAQRRIGEIFPPLKGIEIEHYWEGYCSLSETTLPAVRKLDESVYSVLGFSTRGVSLAQNLGRTVAAFLAESLAEEDLPVAVEPVEPIPLQPVKEFLGGYAFPFYQARDALRLS